MLGSPSVTIGGFDLAVIVVYLAGIVGLGCWAGFRQRRGSQGSDYFLAGRSLRWPVIGAALFSTNISTIHLVSLAEEGYVNGLAYGSFEWMAGFTLIALALFFAPFYIRSNVATLPDFLEKRYDRACRDWLAVLSIVSAIFIHIGFSLFTGAVVLRGLFGIELMTSIVAVAVLTGIYTIVGGLLAVVLTETIQTFILLAGAIVITTLGMHHVGGWSGLAASVDPVKLTILRSAEELPSLPWYSVFLGYPVIGLWYWCADQTIVQRVLGARDENHARVGALFAGFIKILPVFIFVLPGTICLALINQGKLPDTLDKPADTYAFLINHLLPVGLRGLAAAALLAALMSTVSGALNSVATLFSYDLYRRWYPAASERSTIRVGRIVTFCGMLAAIAWSPACSHYGSIFQGVQTLVCMIAPPITAVFVWGVFSKRVNAGGARATLWIGSLLGLAVFLLDWHKETTGWNVPILMATFYLFITCSAVLLGVSIATSTRLTPEQELLVWDTPMQALRAHAWPGIGNYRLLAGLLFVVMIGLYVAFA